jgi:MraZ protein
VIAGLSAVFLGDRVTVRGIFQGHGLQPVDKLGRVAIPVSLRRTLEANNLLTGKSEDARLLSIAPSETDTCLIAYDQHYPTVLAEEYAQRSNALTKPGAPLDRSANRGGHGLVDQVSFDGSGRFTLQGYPRVFADLMTGPALFLAVGDYFEIWNPKVLLAERGEDRRLAGLVNYLMQERGIA